MSETEDQLIAGLASLVGGLDAEMLEPEEAIRLCRYFTRVSRLASAGQTICARRVNDSGAYKESGHRDAATWFAGESGGGIGQALRSLETAEQASVVPELDEALRGGELSQSQADEIARATRLDPSKAPELVDTARTGSLSDLRRHAERVRQAARSEEAALADEERVQRNRRLRMFSGRDGAVHLEARLTKTAGARLIAAVDAEAKLQLEAAKAEGRSESFEAHAADALVALVTSGRLSNDMPAPATVHLRVDLAALKRGSVEHDECCEVPGVGTVSVATARDLLSNSLLNLVVSDGVDIQTMLGTRRTIRRRTYRALVERDPVCVVPGCNSWRYLQIDHWQRDYALGGPTALFNLCRLCTHHHRLKTAKGFLLRGGPGHWEFLSPQEQRERGLPDLGSGITLVDVETRSTASRTSSGPRRRRATAAAATTSRARPASEAAQ